MATFLEETGLFATSHGAQSGCWCGKSRFLPSVSALPHGVSSALTSPQLEKDTFKEDLADKPFGAPHFWVPLCPCMGCGMCVFSLAILTELELGDRSGCLQEMMGPRVAAMAHWKRESARRGMLDRRARPGPVPVPHGQDVDLALEDCVPKGLELAAL
ncbi:Amyloid-beta A4 precursor protein-binding family A member 2 [Plecturocebus cupreus]